MAVEKALVELRADKTRLLRGPRLGGDCCLFAFGGKRSLEEMTGCYYALEEEDDDDDAKAWLPPVVEVDREVSADSS